MKTNNLFLIISLIALIAYSCKKEDNGKPPVLPKASSFLMDFSKLSDTVPANSGDTTTINYNYAVQKLSLWKSLINNTLEIPLAAFLESHVHTPQYLSDGWWSWKSTVVVNQKYYKADLRGKIVENDNIWEVFITEEVGFHNYKWFEGKSDFYNNIGSWYLKNNPYEDSLFLQIDWTNDYYGSADIKYTMISDSDSLKGSYIKYIRDLNPYYNSHYKIFETISNNYSEIHLNRNTEKGQIQDSLFFPDNNFHCWDSLKLDLNCN